MELLIRTVLFLLLLLLLLTAGRTDVAVTCVWSGVCVLPCTSPYHDIIHWYKVGKSSPVHTFYNGGDQLLYQDTEVKGRTSLFIDQIPHGNVSLQLNNSRTADEGVYKCYTATSSDNREQFIKLRVRAPVKEVRLKMLSEELSCSTEAVYPEPKIFWFRNGSAVEKFSVETSGDKEHLFSVSSVLTQRVEENIMYICSIKLGDEPQGYNASLRRVNVVVSMGHSVSIRCPVSQENSGNFTLMFGNSSTILNSSQTSQLPTETTWREKNVHVSRDGTVTIHNLKNSEDTGTYRCVWTTAQSRQEVLTEVQMTSEDIQHASVAVAVAVAVAVGVTVSVFVVLMVAAMCWRYRRRNAKCTRPSAEKSGSSNESNPNETRHLNDTDQHTDHHTD